MSKKFTHINTAGNPSMVDVSDKKTTKRIAKARSVVLVEKAVLAQLEGKGIQTKKGPVFQTAIIAGVMGAKKTSELIPLCHPIGLDNCQIDIHINPTKEIIIDCIASTTSKTGVEMEALTGATVAALTIYDMCKALSPNIIIQETKLMEKTGGKNDFKRSNVTIQNRE